MRISVTLGSMLKKAMSSGSCSRLGRHPPNILTPLSFCNCRISAFMSERRGSVIFSLAYLALMASICGWMRCILTADFMVLMRTGMSTMLMMRVSTTMAHPQLWVMCS